MSPQPAYWQAVPQPPLQLEQLVRGRPVEEVAELLPRLFNLCRAAQGTAARLAFGLPLTGDDLGQEILRDHLMKLCISWPRLLGLAPLPLPANWQDGGAPLVDALFDGPFPGTPDAFSAALASGKGLAPVLTALTQAIPPGFGAAAPLSPAREDTLFDPVAIENSVAGRQADHPVMRSIEATRGRDLFWRAAARIFDLADAARGLMPLPELIAPGRALVPAARGTYALSARIDGGAVLSLTRITPTDHLLASGGILSSTLSNLSARDRETLPLIMAILDPCSPVEIKEAHHA